MPSYYDIDTILAEEELIVVRPSFDFAHLAHLDPDSHRSSFSSRKRPRDDVDKENDAGNNGGNSGDGSSKRQAGKTSRSSPDHFLAEGTKFKMPMWAIDRWAMLGFVKIPSLPRHYGKRTKERLEADPLTMDLRSKNEYYFVTGTLLANLLHRTAHVAKLHSPSRRTSSLSAPSAQSLVAQQLSFLATSLQYSLLTSFLGSRLVKNFDWTLGALDRLDGSEDDVSNHVMSLSYLERMMFERGVEASGAVREWKEGDIGRLGVSFAVLKARCMGRGRRVIDASVGGNGAGDEKRTRRMVSPMGVEDIGRF